MSSDETQQTWHDYYAAKKMQRLAEASLLWAQLGKSGVTAETPLVLDFVHFGTSKQNVDDLAKQLAENYQLQVLAAAAESYWLAKGTTRPYGITLDQAQHLSWVEFMTDVAPSHGCVFSSWSIEVPSLGIRLSSEQVESGS